MIIFVRDGLELKAIEVSKTSGFYQLDSNWWFSTF